MTSKDGLEIETCGRCGGCGQYSYNQIDGTRCFGCGGSGVKFTKRGLAAHRYLQSLRERTVEQLMPGNLIYNEPSMFNKGGFKRVISVGPSKSHCISNGKIIPYIEIETDGFNQCVFAGTKLRVGHTKEGKAATAELARQYQAMLTKTGSLMKGKIAPEFTPQDSWVVRKSPDEKIVENNP